MWNVCPDAHINELAVADNIDNSIWHRFMFESTTSQLVKYIDEQLHFFPDMRMVVLDFLMVQSVDSSGCNILSQFLRNSHKELVVLFASLSPSLLQVMVAHGIFVANSTNLFHSVDRAVEW